MSFANKHNKGAIEWNVNTEGFSFVTREECYKAGPDNVHKLFGLYINTKGKFGDHPVAICENAFIDFPDYMTEDIKAILQDPEDVAAIKAGKVGFKIEEFQDKKFKKTCYGIKWVDLEG